MTSQKVNGIGLVGCGHRLTKNSGSLLMHKSTHMFDIINWFVNSTPKTVSAQAAKTYYLPEETGGHGGADINLMKAVFGMQADDVQEADSTDGYWSVALADAANKSIITDK